MITRIFLDLDDVLVDFTIPALRWTTENSEFKYEDYDPKWGFDIVLAHNIITGQNASRKEFWQMIDRPFWASLSITGTGRFLIDFAATLVGRDSVAILTSPIDDPMCYAGKAEWAMCKCPPWLAQNMLVGSAKQLAAQPNALLIDDSDSNVERWRSRGGVAILWPRPWNDAHGDIGMPADCYLREELKFVFADHKCNENLYRTFR